MNRAYTVLMKDNAKSEYEEKYQLPSIYLHFFFCRFFHFHSIKFHFPVSLAHRKLELEMSIIILLQPRTW